MLEDQYVAGLMGGCQKLGSPVSSSCAYVRVARRYNFLDTTQPDATRYSAQLLDPTRPVGLSIKRKCQIIKIIYGINPVI